MDKIEWHPHGTPGPWECIPPTEHHGAYVGGPWGGDICDCYCMSNPECASVRNGGISYPIPHQGKQSETNARAIAEVPAMVLALRLVLPILRDALPKFDWAKSPLDASAIAALAKMPNPDAIAAILARIDGEV